MTTRQTNRMKATIWSASMKSEVDGPTDAVIEPTERDSWLAKLMEEV